MRISDTKAKAKGRARAGVTLLAAALATGCGAGGTSVPAKAPATTPTGYHAPSYPAGPISDGDDGDGRDCTTNGNPTFSPTPSQMLIANGVITAEYATPNDDGSNGNGSFQGGPTIGIADIELIFWGNEWASLSNSQAETQVISQVKTLIASGYYSALGQYGLQGVELNGILNVPGDPKGSFDCGSDVGGMVQGLIGNGIFPKSTDPGGRLLYVVFMPPGATSNDPQAAAQHCGPSYYVPPANIYYNWVAWIGNSNVDQMMIDFSHETAEAISDPEPNSGFIMDTFLNCGVEISDACWHSQDRVNGVAVQAYWSQQQHACVIPFLAPPTLTGISPATGPILGGTTVTLTGTNFDVEGRTQVMFGTRPATNVQCASATSCTVTVPSGNYYGAAAVSVTVQGFAAAETQPYSYVPLISDVEPRAGNTGDQVTITGYDFGYIPSSIAIYFGSTKATTFTCSNSTTCTVTVPPGCGGVDVQIVINGFASVLNPDVDGFSFNGPIITGIDPASGPAAGGTDVNLDGSSFDTSMQVIFKDTVTGVETPSTHVFCPYTNWCIATSPPNNNGANNVGGTSKIIARLLGCSSLPAPAPFTYLPPASRVTSLSVNASGVATVQLDDPAPSSGAVVTLASSDTSTVTVPATVTVAAGATTASFSVTWLPTTLTETVTLSASFDGTTATTTVSVVPKAAPLPALSLSPDDAIIYNGMQSSVTVTISPAAPSTGAVIALSSSQPTYLPVPATVTVPAGATWVAFPVTSSYTGSNLGVTLGAAYNGMTSTASVALRRAPKLPPGGGGGGGGLQQ